MRPPTPGPKLGAAALVGQLILSGEQDDERKNKVFLVGDNPLASTDSRDFGWLPQEHIIGRVIWPQIH